MNLKIFTTDGLLPTDSSEYELLIEAAKEACKVVGMGCEVGVRRGGASRMIMDTFIQEGKYKTHLMIDPWGDIPYLVHDMKDVPIPKTDYTNDMRATCITELYVYYHKKLVNPIVLPFTDDEFFKRFPDYYQTYGNGETHDETHYCIVHLDGPHAVEPILKEARFFAPRMLKGAMLVCDDVDFYQHDEKVEPILLGELGFEKFKRGKKKAVYRKKADG
jgi:methyltransferase family protein